MKKIIMYATVVALLFALAPMAALADGTASTDPKAPTPPPGGYPPVYRLMFATETGFDAIGPNMAWYNTQVNNAANNLGGETGSTVAGLSTWLCVGAGVSVDARTNSRTLLPGDAGYDPAWDVPIYNFAGSLLADSNAHMWDGGLQEPGYQTDGIWDGWSYETGVEPSALTAVNGNIYASVWTGTDAGGNIRGDGKGMDSGNVIQTARGERTYSGDWIAWGSGLTPTDPRGGEWNLAEPRLYALSAPIVPEPSTISLLALCGLSVLMFLRRRRA